MIAAKCTFRHRDYLGNIDWYTLVDGNGAEQNVAAKELKNAIHNNLIHVTNLKLTSDNRLIEIEDKEEQINKWKMTLMYGSHINYRDVVHELRTSGLWDILKDDNIDTRLDLYKCLDYIAGNIITNKLIKCETRRYHDTRISKGFIVRDIQDALVNAELQINLNDTDYFVKVAVKKIGENNDSADILFVGELTKCIYAAQYLQDQYKECVASYTK